MADAAWKTVIDNIESAFKTEFDKNNGSGSYDVQYENEGGFSKPDDTVYMRFFVRPGGGETVSIGSTKTKRITGLIMVQCIAPAGSDYDSVRNASGEVQDWFDHRTISGTNAVYCYSSYPTTVGKQGGEYQENVNVPFAVDFSSS